MHEANLKIIANLKNFIRSTCTNRETQKRFCVSDRNFVRNRKLPFSKLVLLIIKLCKKTLSVELEKFFEEMNGIPCSVSAFTQQRLKLKPSFFNCLNKVLQKSFYLHYGNTVKRWRGYRIIAGDGSSINLVIRLLWIHILAARATSKTVLCSLRLFIITMFLMNWFSCHK